MVAGADPGPADRPGPGAADQHDRDQPRPVRAWGDLRPPGGDVRGTDGGGGAVSRRCSASPATPTPASCRAPSRAPAIPPRGSPRPGSPASHPTCAAISPDARSPPGAPKRSPTAATHETELWPAGAQRESACIKVLTEYASRNGAVASGQAPQAGPPGPAQPAWAGRAAARWAGWRRHAARRMGRSWRRAASGWCSRRGAAAARPARSTTSTWRSGAARSSRSSASRAAASPRWRGRWSAWCRRTSGEVRYGGAALRYSGAALRAHRRHVQLVLQDPAGALNPRQNVFDAVAEGPRLHGMRAGLTGRVHQALARAGLRPPEQFIARYPHELSGGQQQRVVIAGALALDPAVIVADEPVSSLDASVRGEILKLILDLREQLSLAALIVSHDLGVAWNVADRVAVMYLGRIVEVGPVSEVLLRPRHPYTQALISVLPDAGRDAAPRRSWRASHPTPPRSRLGAASTRAARGWPPCPRATREPSSAAASRCRSCRPPPRTARPAAWWPAISRRSTSRPSTNPVSHHLRECVNARRCDHRRCGPRRRRRRRRCAPASGSPATASPGSAHRNPASRTGTRCHRRDRQGGLPGFHQHPQPLQPEHPARPAVAGRAHPGRDHRGVRRGHLDGPAHPADAGRTGARPRRPGLRGLLDPAVGVPQLRRAPRHRAERGLVHRRGHAASERRRPRRPPGHGRRARPDARAGGRGDGRRRPGHRLGADLPARQLRGRRRADRTVPGRRRIRRLLRLAHPQRGRAVCRRRSPSSWRSAGRRACAARCSTSRRPAARTGTRWTRRSS